jgi:mevalonate kinase
MGKGSGYGKVILFNEHFVVYGIPAIAASVGRSTFVEVEKSEKGGIIIEDRRKGSKGYSESKQKQQEEAVNIILNAMNIDPSEVSLKIRIGGDLPAFSGIGASAANCVAITRAISDEFSLDLKDKRINEIAYEAEKAYAGTPSGIDNTVATYGGLIWFKKGDEISFEKLYPKKPVEIVMVNSGEVADTKAVIEKVRKRREEFPEEYNKIFEEAEELVKRARETVTTSNFRLIGELMNQNHELLKRINVSSQLLDKMVDLAKRNGALGAKLTGGGVGGCIVALTPGKDLQEKVASVFEEKGYQVLKTSIGGGK